MKISFFIEPLEKSYKSQYAYDEERWQIVEGAMRSSGQYFGSLIGTRYGEPFASREKLGLRDIRDLI
ncbi:MAG: hypothetical protein H8D23_20510 [Candidatus Brocadiales bacterium]|nr:hypothetical protein [Candidatus Brocadiales bacterium]